MHSLIIRILRTLIAPTATLIVAKLVGLISAIYIGGYDWDINFGNSSFADVYPVVYATNLEAISTGSDFIMILIMGIVIFGIVLQAFFLHETHIHPKTTARLFKFDLHHLVQSSNEIYFKFFAWLVVYFIGILATAINVWNGSTKFWVLFVGITFGVVMLVFILQDLQSELENLFSTKSSKAIS